MLRRAILTCSLLSLISCSHNLSNTELGLINEDGKSESIPSLAEAYKDYFKVGAAVDSGSYISHADLLKKHFNSLTTENEMKFEALQPQLNQFTFEVADAMLDFARNNDMATRGHALIWHRQTPDWVFQDADGEPVSEEVLRQRMNHHISTVMKHFGRRVDVWDVVNEAVMDDGRLRTFQEEGDDQKSRWFDILGEAYIEDAFRFAHQANPDAKLFYNDYYNYLPARREAIYGLLKNLLEKGVPVHGVGLQCHLNIHASDDPTHQSYYQTIENLEKSIQLYASLGLDVQITELDVSVYVGGKAKSEKDYYTLAAFSPELQAEQAKRYKELFEMFRRNKNIISNVTFWGVADDNTWLSEFASGRQDFPMLFDIKHQPKPAFDAVINF